MNWLHWLFSGSKSVQFALDRSVALEAEIHACNTLIADLHRRIGLLEAKPAPPQPIEKKQIQARSWSEFQTLTQSQEQVQ